mgnify:CR=1 FL=1
MLDKLGYYCYYYREPGNRAREQSTLIEEQMMRIAIPVFWLAVILAGGLSLAWAGIWWAEEAVAANWQQITAEPPTSVTFAARTFVICLVIGALGFIRLQRRHQST